jgi:pyridoxamine 5'-phosphate oxidase family protein
MARTTFTGPEIAYLNQQRLARIATVDRWGAPRVVPTGFRYNPDTGTIDCSGSNFHATRRFHDVQSNPFVAITIDDLAPGEAWRPRAVMVRGTAETFADAGAGFTGAWMRITPTSISSQGLNPD